jgi:FKBP-type peptidyl-prolyl cis-trans isomerase
MLSFKYLKSTLGIFLIFGLVSISCNNQTATYPEKASMNTLVDSVSYAIGYQNGSQLTAQGFENADLDNFIAGFQAGQKGTENEMSTVNIQELFGRFGQYLMDQMKVENMEEQESFLAENRMKDGVMETESGLQYKVIEEGTGASPTPENTVVVQYEGTLIDGTRFDGTYDELGNPGEPAEFVLGGVIPGWTEGLQLMKEGAVYMFYIPSELAYGENPRPGGAIQPNDMLIFKIALEEVK